MTSHRIDFQIRLQLLLVTVSQVNTIIKTDVNLQTAIVSQEQRTLTYPTITKLQPINLVA